MAKSKIKAAASPVLTRMAIIGEFRLLLGQALDPETMSAVNAVRKDRDYSAKIALSMRYIDPAFVRQSMVKFEQFEFDDLKDWLDRRAVWVEYIEGVKNRLDLNAGIPERAVNEFGFQAKYRGAASGRRAPTIPFPS